ncbi:MAG TPA: ABC-type transport auxiliary lipoprotein family protein [Myxococcales bacterium]
MRGAFKRFALAALLGLAACPAPPTRHYYTLTFPPGQARYDKALPFTVRVKDFAINATYNGDQLVYREDVNEVSYDKERRWTERPQRMVADVARKYLRQSGLFEQVIEKLGERPPDFVLEGEIDAIEELVSGEDSYAHLAVSLRLVRFENDTVVWRRSFDERRKIPGGKARVVVRTLSEILEQELAKSVDELGKHFATAANGAPPSSSSPSAAPDAAHAAVPAPAPASDTAAAVPAKGPGDNKLEPVPAVQKAEEPARPFALTGPAPSGEALRPDPTSPLASLPQLLADETDMPAGKGAVFFPSLSGAGDREPPLAVYKDGELVAQGKMGERVVLDPGTYVAQFGSGAGRQQTAIPVAVEEGRVTVAPASWAALELRVVNERFIGFRGNYELISMPAREEYGVGFGVDEELGEELKVWVLPPGLYKVVQAGGNYRDRVNFATVYLVPGKLTHFTLVRDPDSGDFKGAGVFTEEESAGGVDGPWKKLLVLGGDVKVGYGNDAASNGWSFDIGLFVDAMVRYLKEPHLFVSRLELEEGILRPASTQRFEPYYDRLYFHNIYTFHFLPWLGPYVRAGAETKILPRYKDYDQPVASIDVVDAQGNPLETLTNVDRIQLGNPFAPLQLKEGLGGNVRALHTLWIDLDLRLGVGARQYFPFGELALDTSTGADRLRRVSEYHLEGVEGAVVASGRISRWVILTTELDGLMPFTNVDNTVFTWRTQVSLRLVSFASLNYLLNVTRDPNRRAGPITTWQQLFQLRFSYSVF